MPKPTVFLDSNVILDVFANREPYYQDSAKLLSLIEQKHVLGFTTPLVFANIHYILRKLKSKEEALQNLRKLRILVSVLALDENHTDSALNSDFSDFEDALQYYSAKGNSLDCIITRNKKDYKTGSVSVYTPTEYLALLASSNRGNNKG